MWIFFLIPLLGCYTYAETSLDALSPGLQARVRLDEEGFGRVLNQAATNGVPVETMDIGGRGVSGRVVAVEAENLVVELRGVGSSVYAADIPTRSIREVGLRQLSRRRTVGAVAGLGLLAFVTLKSGLVGGSTSAEGPEEPELLVVPWFSIPFP